MSEVRITCINKDGGNHLNPHEGITHYGWINQSGKTGRSNRAAMVEWIEANNKAYVQDPQGNRAYCAIRVSSAGNKFLQTYSDGRYGNNLLSLPECS
jgi:hypothetical protein